MYAPTKTKHFQGLEWTGAPRDLDRALAKKRRKEDMGTRPHKHCFMVPEGVTTKGHEVKQNNHYLVVWFPMHKEDATATTLDTSSSEDD